MQKVYADKKLGIDPKAVFQKPAELDNNPIYADQIFNGIVQKGEGSDFTDEGNGNKGDYEGSELTAPVESEFGKNDFKDLNDVPSKDKGGENILPKDEKKDDGKPIDKKEVKILPPVIKPDDKTKKPAKPVKNENDY
jgi:hypothetical protein